MIDEGKLIKELRLERGLTQTKLAKMAGINNQTLCNIEHRVHGVSLYVFQQIIDAMGYELKIVRKSDERHDI